MKVFNVVLVGVLTAIFILGLVVWWTGGLGNIMPARQSQAAAAAAALLTSDTYAIVSDTWTNTLNAGSETAVEGDVCYTTPPGTPPVSINGVTVTPLTEATVPCPPQVGLDQASALADLNGESCTLIGTDVALDTIIIGTNPPGTFPPGCYESSGTMDITLSTTVTLDLTAPDGDGGDVWIFRSGGALTTGANSFVILENGADANNVFWTPGSTASLGANSSSSATPTFVGTIIADELGSTGVNLGHFAHLLGRVLAFGHTVTTDSNTITVPPPSSPPPPTTATLHVIKEVINTSGGTAVASDFTLHVTSATSSLDVAGSPLAGTSTPGTLYTLSPGTYTVSEDLPDPLLYTQNFFGADCAPSDGVVTLLAGEDKVCTIINTDIPPPAPVSSGGGGGGSNTIVPLIGITKVPTPLALPGGSGSVTYNYTVWNVGGQRALTDVTVTDDKCGPLTLLSGDTDGDADLGISETWHYSCTTTISTTTTNTAIATGYGADSNHDITVATAIATVVVGVPGLPDTGVAPLIDIVKVPSRLIPFPVGGGEVVYIYTVTNPGVVEISNVVVTDDKCAPVYQTAGDINGNNLLEPSESWTYACQAYISVSTRNVATARGITNGFLAIDYAFATVLVAVPGLPNTGIPPEKSSGAPVRLEIPEIGVDTTLENVGLTPEGEMDVPSGPTNAAWFELGPRPGEKGTSVIAGHFGWKEEKEAVFDNLHKLNKGDEIYVRDEKGVTTTFVVRDSRTYGANEDPPGVFDSGGDKAHLNLITCGGVWSEEEKSYSNRLVVFADKKG